jgi:hypothetical protein
MTMARTLCYSMFCSFSKLLLSERLELSCEDGSL